MEELHDWYLVLGIHRKATPQEIASAFRKRALTCHPDKRPGCQIAAQQFLLLQRASDELSDGTTRAAFDDELAAREMRKGRRDTGASREQPRTGFKPPKQEPRQQAHHDAQRDPAFAGGRSQHRRDEANAPRRAPPDESNARSDPDESEGLLTCLGVLDNDKVFYVLVFLGGLVMFVGMILGSMELVTFAAFAMWSALVSATVEQVFAAMGTAGLLVVVVAATSLWGEMELIDAVALILGMVLCTGMLVLCVLVSVDVSVALVTAKSTKST